MRSKDSERQTKNGTINIPKEKTHEAFLKELYDFIVWIMDGYYGDLVNEDDLSEFMVAYRTEVKDEQ